MKKFLLSSFVAFFIVCSLSAQTATLKQQEIAPGIYKLSLGSVDTHTPFTLIPEQAKTQAITQMPKGRLPFNLNAITISKTKRGCSVAIPLTDGETIYGFGLQVNTFTQEGLKKRPIVSDSPPNSLGYTNAPQTFYISSAGYGILINTARYTTFHCGTNRLKANQGNYVFADIPNVEGIDVFVISGTNTKDVVERYNLLSGGGCLPPMWGLGLKYLVKSDAAESHVNTMADYFRKTNIPCDVLGLDTSWQTTADTSSYVWSNHFPNHQKMVKDLREKGFRISLWERAFVHQSSPIHKAMTPYSGSFLVKNGLVPDFTIAESRNIFTRHHQTLLSEGIAGFKLDESDNSDVGDGHSNWGFPDMSTFPSGLDGEQMHQLFGSLYLKTIDGMYRKNNIRSYQTIRSSGMFTASVPAALYGASYFSNQEYIQMTCASAFSGLLLSSEIRDAGSEEEFFHRLQTVLLSPLAMISAYGMSNPPWMQYDRDRNNRHELLSYVEEMEGNVRQLVNTRMALIPYLYAAFNDYRNKGTPPFRPLIMDYPNDKKCRDLRDQYMIGDNIMAAPLYRDGNKRTVYFPAGRWYNFNTNELYQGGRTYDIETKYSELPIYIKNGSILPLAEPLQSVTDDSIFEITCKVYGTNPRDFELFEDDGVSYNYEKGVFNQVILSVKNKAGNVSRTGSFKGKRYNVINWEFIQ